MLLIWRAVDVNPLGPVQLHDPPVTGCGPRSTTVAVEVTVALVSSVQVPLTEMYGVIAVGVQLPLPFTVNETVVAADVPPEFPVTVTLELPVAAVLLAVSVSTLELVDEAGLNEAVTPLGRPDAVNDTLPVNPSTSVTLMVSVELAP
jgi:hypothetical protein